MISGMGCAWAWAAVLAGAVEPAAVGAAAGAGSPPSAASVTTDSSGPLVRAVPSVREDASARPPILEMKVRMPRLGIGIGPVLRLGPSGGAWNSAAGVDATFGWMMGYGRPGGAAGERERLLFVLPQVGYSFVGSGPSATHLFVLGPGVGVGSRLIFVAYTPRFVAGSAQDQRAVGIRHGLSASLMMGVLSVEVAHQWLHVGGDLGSQHDLRLTLDVNLASLFGMISALRMG